MSKGREAITSLYFFLCLGKKSSVFLLLSSWWWAFKLLCLVNCSFWLRFVIILCQNAFKHCSNFLWFNIFRDDLRSWKYLSLECTIFMLSFTEIVDIYFWLQLLISGSLDSLDVDDLRCHTNYAGGYHGVSYLPSPDLFFVGLEWFIIPRVCFDS